MHRWAPCVLVVAGSGMWLGPSMAAAQVVEAPYDASYQVSSLGTVPALPVNYGGLTFKDGDANRLLIGGSAAGPAGAVFEVPLTRGGDGHITGFAGDATLYCEGAYVDGGLTYGPAGVLFFTRWPVNEVAQVLPNSATIAKIVPLEPLGVASSAGGMMFVPPGYPAAGTLKIVSWSGGQLYTVAIAPDGGGTYDLPTATQTVTLTGGPEGFTYVPKGSPLFAGNAMLVSKWSAGVISTYEVDANADPIVATRTVFVSGLNGAEGAAVDPATGDFLFSSYSGSPQVYLVRGFALPAGSPCTADLDCGTGFCVDGVCCDAACDGSCEACSMAEGSSVDGGCEPVSVGTCDDGDACTDDDLCAAGACVGTRVVCEAADACHEVGVCDPVDGICSSPSRADGAPCEGGVCEAGVCVDAGAGGAGAAGGSGVGGSPGVGGADAGSGGTVGAGAVADDGGCGCVVVGRSQRRSWPLVVAALVASWRRRRRRSSAR